MFRDLIHSSTGLFVQRGFFPQFFLHVRIEYCLVLRQVKTKRGIAGFGEESLILSENYLDYFRNLYTELWVEGEEHHKISLLFMVFAVSFGFTLSGLAVATMNSYSLLIILASLVCSYGLVWVFQRYRGFTKQGKISYSDIDSVDFVEGTKWLTCPRFVINYDNGRRRYISMHSYLLPGVEDRVDSIVDGFEENGFEVR